MIPDAQRVEKLSKGEKAPQFLTLFYFFLPEPTYIETSLIEMEIKES